MIVVHVVVVTGDLLVAVGVVVVLLVLVCGDCLFVMFDVEVVLSLTGMTVLALVISLISNVVLFEVIISETDAGVV